MAQNEQLQDIEIRNQVFLEGYKNGRVNEFTKVIVKLGRDAGIAVMSLDIERMNQLTKKQLNALTVNLRAIAGKSIGDQVEALNVDLAKLSEQQAGFEVKAIESVTKGATVATPASGAAMSFANNQPIRATGNFMKKFWSTMTANEQSQLVNVVQIGYSDGLTIPQMVSRIRGTRVANYSDGYTQQAKRRIEAQVRTATQHVSQRSREQTWNANSDIIEKYEWVSTLDGRTSSQCRSLSNNRYIVGQGPVPPIHYNAIAQGGLITSNRGKIPIENIMVGDLVLTHMGRWMPVTAVMSRDRHPDEKVLKLVDGFGRSISLTDDHPMLSAKGGWKRAGDINPGDVLFKNLHKFFCIKNRFFAPFIEHVILINSHNIPTKTTEKLISYDVSRLPGAMASSIKLDKAVGYSEIRYKAINTVLKIKRNFFRFQKFLKHKFMWRWVL